MVRCLIALALGLLVSSCAPRSAAPPEGRRLTGTCEGTCDYYLTCSGAADRAVHRECIADCRDIFVEEGEPDQHNLRQLESLECSELVLFIEGDGGRAPGQPAAPTSTTSRAGR